MTTREPVDAEFTEPRTGRKGLILGLAALVLVIGLAWWGISELNRVFNHPAPPDAARPLALAERAPAAPTVPAALAVAEPAVPAAPAAVEPAAPAAPIADERLVAASMVTLDAADGPESCRIVLGCPAGRQCERADRRTSNDELIAFELAIRRQVCPARGSLAAVRTGVGRSANGDVITWTASPQ